MNWSLSRVMAKNISSRNFGYLPGGESIEAWTLCFPGNLEVEVITYGATITRVLAPDRHGRMVDVVLGFNDLDSYLTGDACFGALIGRVAGRITGGRFNVEGKTYQLALNDGSNHLHGGVKGFDKRVWKAKPIEDPDGTPSLRLSYMSLDGEEGYPGEARVTVTYTVTRSNVLLVETEAAANQPTPLNLTQHSYFNLAGEGAGSIVDHELQIHSDQFVITDERMTLLGRVGSVAGRGCDFRRPKILKDAIPALFQNHGDLYVVRRPAEDSLELRPVPIARLAHPESGRVLEVSTTETHMQFYTGVGLNGTLIGKSDVAYARHAGLCFECEGYPDGVNTSTLGDIILRPGNPRRATTTYAFCTS
jgi:aldose 1-epimerase